MSTELAVEVRGDGLECPGCQARNLRHLPLRRLQFVGLLPSYWAAVGSVSTVW